MHTLTGTFESHEQFHSRYLPDDREILVYLPPDYATAPGRRYPVLYMHDGQNVFDSETSFAGDEWCADETAESLTRDGVINPLIIVAIYNSGPHRIDEYTLTPDSHGQHGGKADLYASMLIEELKPFIDRTYRTLPGPRTTGMGGSSMGGLVTLYVGLKHPGVFGQLAVMSPSIWWDQRAILRFVRNVERPHVRPRIWLDMGTEEGVHPVDNLLDAQMLRDVLLQRGWTLEEDLAYFEAEGAGHNERAWAARMGNVMRFLFGEL